MSQQWKPGDTVAFTLTGRILQISGDFVYLETPDNPLLLHRSHILGTPEQAKRERTMAILMREFPMFRFEEAKNTERGFFWIRIQDAPNELIEQWLDAIRKRMEELQETTA